MSTEDNEEQEIEKYNKLRNICLKNSEDLLRASKLALDNGIDHVAFHLAVLALEEIGKIDILGYKAISTQDKTKEENFNIDTDDHEKKLFFAIWSPSFGREKFSKKQLQEKHELARNLHERRLHYLYVEPEDVLDWRQKMEKGEAKRVYDFVEVTFKLEKEGKGGMRTDMAPEEKAELQWFFDINKDPEKRKEIWSQKSQEKLIELGNSKDWIKWLKEIYSKNEEEMRKLSEQEMKRQKPTGKEAFKPKYKIRIKIQSQSHSIRNNAFQKWNEGVKDIKIYKSQYKDKEKAIKSEILVDILLPKGIHIGMVWDHGLFISKTFVMALNIATNGLFWWNVQKDIEKYYEEITDLDTDKSGNTKIKIVTGKRLAIDWGEGRFVLDEHEMVKVSSIFAFLMKENEKLKDFLIEYAQGMVLISKTDVHLRLEPNSFEEFFKAFKKALIIFKDWDGKSNLKEAILNQFTKLQDTKEIERVIDLANSLDFEHGKFGNITLTEVATIKTYLEVYIHIKANEYYAKLKPKDLPKKD